MQPENHSSSDFSERTQVLADHLGVSLRELADAIGISQAMLFGYRSGKYHPTLKAWRKLEAAEAKHGIHPAGCHSRSDDAPHPPTQAHLGPDLPVPDIAAVASDLVTLLSAIHQDPAASLHRQSLLSLADRLRRLADSPPPGRSSLLG